LLYTEVPLFIFLFQACEKLISQWIHFWCSIRLGRLRKYRSFEKLRT
jgi:hypothetical protein